MTANKHNRQTYMHLEAELILARVYGRLISSFPLKKVNPKKPQLHYKTSSLSLYAPPFPLQLHPSYLPSTHQERARNILIPNLNQAPTTPFSRHQPPTCQPHHHLSLQQSCSKHTGSTPQICVQPQRTRHGPAVAPVTDVVPCKNCISWGPPVEGWGGGQGGRPHD